MIEIPLVEWARQNNIHYNTAKRRFDKGLMPNAEYNNLGRIIVYLEHPVSDDKEEIYARIRKRVQESPVYINHNPRPAPTLQSPMVKQSEEMPPIPPKPKAPGYIKKEKKVIVPSILEGEELEAENLRRCRELGLNYDYVTKTLQRNFFGLPGDFSQYMDEYERSKMKVPSFISIRNAEMEALFPDTSNHNDHTPVKDETPPKKERSEFDIAFDLCEENGKDYDYVKFFLNKDGNECLAGDHVIIEFMEQYKKGKGKELEEWAIERVIANRNK